MKLMNHESESVYVQFRITKTSHFKNWKHLYAFTVLEVVEKKTLPSSRSTEKAFYKPYGKLSFLSSATWRCVSSHTLSEDRVEILSKT